MRNVMSLIKTFFLIFTSSLIALIILELGVRHIFPETVLFNRFHSTVTYGEFQSRSLTPNIQFKHTSEDGEFIFQTNSSGFRMIDDVHAEKDENTLRVLILGDSHTQGFEVQQNETFSEELNKKVCNGRVLEVVNTGISGSGTSEHLVALQHWVQILKPDVTIEAFYPNDIQNNMNAFHTLDNGEISIMRYQHPATDGIKILEAHNSFWILRFLSQNSYAYSILMNFGWEQGKKLFYKNNRSDVSDRVELDDDLYNQSDLVLLNKILQRMSEITRPYGTFLIIPIPSLDGYNPKDFFDSTTIKYLVNIEFGSSEDWHVPNGHRHINAAAHSHIAAGIYSALGCARIQ